MPDLTGLPPEVAVAVKVTLAVEAAVMLTFVDTEPPTSEDPDATYW